MTASLHEIGGEGYQAMVQRPDLKLHSGNEQLGADPTDIFPTVQFDFKDTHFIGNENIQANEETRVNAILRELSRVSYPDDSLSEQQQQELQDVRRRTDPKARGRHINRVNSFMTQEVTIVNPRYDETAEKSYRTPKTIAVRRKEALDHQDTAQANAAVLEHLIEENHPVAQAINQVGERYKAILEDEENSTFTWIEMDNVITQVLRYTHWDELKKAYQEILDQKRPA